MDGPCDYGHFDIVLADFLKKNSISKNQLSEKANLQRTQLNSYCKKILSDQILMSLHEFAMR